MTASIQTTILRKSLAIDCGNPPSEADINNFTLCRRTQRSHSNLIATAALLDGDYVAFLDSIGYDNSADVTRNLDNRYWRNLCAYLKVFIPQFEAHVMEEFEKNGEKAIANIAKAFNFPVEAISYYSLNKEAIKQFLDNIRPELGSIAEMHMVRHIAEGSESMIKWYLPRALPERYHLSGSPEKELPRDVRLVFEGDE